MPAELIEYEDVLGGEIIRSALRTEGVLKLACTLRADLVTRFFTAAQALFFVPQTEKDRCLRHGMSGGFTPPGIEGVRNHGPDDGRSFWDTLDPESGENRYPESLAGQTYQSAADELFRQAEAATLSLLRSAYPDVAALAEGGRHLLRASRYESEAPGQVVFPSHLDFGLMTAYIGGAEPGLQGWIGGAWTDLVARPGDLIVSAGTTLRLYDPAASPLRHRVVGSGRSRISAVFFTEPRGDVMLPNGARAADHLHRLVSQIRCEP